MVPCPASCLRSHRGFGKKKRLNNMSFLNRLAECGAFCACRSANHCTMCFQPCVLYRTRNGEGAETPTQGAEAPSKGRGAETPRRGSRSAKQRKMRRNRNSKEPRREPKEEEPKLKEEAETSRSKCRLHSVQVAGDIQALIRGPVLLHIGKHEVEL